jgi:RAP1 GTPase activating protein 1
VILIKVFITFILKSFIDDSTGTHSVFARVDNYEIMFHVAPMLPGRITDGQRIDRKRHIGNDIVLIIFQDDPSASAFRMSSIRSKQNHIICFVSPKQDAYELLIAPRKEVPYFTPDLPEPPIIGTDATSREFLLHKCKSYILFFFPSLIQLITFHSD